MKPVEVNADAVNVNFYMPWIHKKTTDSNVFRGTKGNINPN